MYESKKLKFMPYASAKVKIYDGQIILQSYATDVIIIDENGFMRCTGTYSQTTRKHIGAFIKEFAPQFNYYTAKMCYLSNQAINVNTGEVIDLWCARTSTSPRT